jgi:membrane-associated phospholipid phosphatase
MTEPLSLRRAFTTDLRDIRPLSPLDRLTLVYVAFTTGVVVAHLLGWRHGGIPRQLGGTMLFANLLLLVAAAVAPRARCSRSRGFIAEWYAAIVLIGLYAVVGLLNEPTAGPAPSFDLMVQGWDFWLFGAQPAYSWPRAWPNFWVAEFLSFCYLAFYAVGIGCPAVLWAIGKKAEARQAIFALLLTMFSCYSIFLLFPVAGPPYFWPWAEGPAWTGPLTEAARNVINGGDSWGSAFPSSHVAGSVVALVFAFRGWRPLGWILLVPVAGIFVAVVYLQIHYGIDAIAGLAMAAIASFLAPRLCPLHPPASEIL